MLQRPSVLDLVGLLRLEKETFSRSERRLIDVVLGDIEVALNSSIVELAALADVSPPTVTRFCRRLGCESFSAFKVRLAQSRFLGQRYLQPPGGPETVPDIARHIVNCVQSTLYKFFESMDGDAVERAAGQDRGGQLRADVRLRRRLLDDRARTGEPAVPARPEGRRVDRSPGPDDARGGSAEGHGDRRLVDERQQCAACQSAGDRRLLRHHPHRDDAARRRWWPHEADILLGLDIPEAQDILRPSASRYAFLAMTDVIAQVVATRMQAPAIATMRRIKHQLVINRDGDDTQALGD